MKHVNIPIFIPHLGCPFTCIFCNQRQIAAEKPLPPGAIAALIDKHLETIPAGSEVEIAFFGGSFTMVDTGLQESYLAEVYPYLKNGRVQGLRLSTRPDGIDSGRLNVLKRWGVTTVELGVQSFDDQVLQRAGRGMKRDGIAAACRLVKEYAFKLGIQLMVGLPGDEPQKVLDTVKTTIALQADMVRIYPTLVIKGTKLAQLWRKGFYQPLLLSRAVEICADMLMLFQFNNIPVIRLGLQPNEDLNSPEILLAGPYHPAFGELVEQHIFYLQAKALLDDVQSTIGLPQRVDLLVNPRDLSKLIGSHRHNIIRLKQDYKLERLEVSPDRDMGLNNLGLSLPLQGNGCLLERTGFIKHFINTGLFRWKNGVAFDGSPDNCWV